MDINQKNKIDLIINKYKEKDLKPYISLSTSGAVQTDNTMFAFLKDKIQCMDFSIPTLNN